MEATSQQNNGTVVILPGAIPPASRRGSHMSHLSRLSQSSHVPSEINIDGNARHGTPMPARRMSSQVSSNGGLGAARTSFIENIPGAVVNANTARRRRRSSAVSVSRALVHGAASMLFGSPTPFGGAISEAGEGGGNNNNNNNNNTNNNNGSGTYAVRRLSSAVESHGSAPAGIQICSVCLDEVVIGEGSARPVTCVHTFHWKCLSEVIAKHACVCPNCREPIDAVLLDGSSDPTPVEAPARRLSSGFEHVPHRDSPFTYDEDPLVDTVQLNAVLDVLHSTASRRAHASITALCLPLTVLLFIGFLLTVLAALERVAPSAVVVMPISMWSFVICATEGFLVSEVGLNRRIYALRILTETLKVIGTAVLTAKIDGALAGDPPYGAAMIGLWLYAPLPVLASLLTSEDPRVPFRRRLALASPVIINVWFPLVVASALIVARLDGAAHVSAYYIATPVLYAALCTALLVPATVWVTFSSEQRRNHDHPSLRCKYTVWSALLCVIALTLLTVAVILAAMRVDSALRVSWFIVLMPVISISIATIIVSIMYTPHAWVSLNEAKFQYDLTALQLLYYLRGSQY